MHNSQLNPDDEGQCGLEYIKLLSKETTIALPPQKEEASTTNFLKSNELQEEEEDIEIKSTCKNIALS